MGSFTEISGFVCSWTRATKGKLSRVDCLAGGEAGAFSTGTLEDDKRVSGCSTAAISAAAAATASAARDGTTGIDSFSGIRGDGGGATAAVAADTSEGKGFFTGGGTAWTAGDKTGIGLVGAPENGSTGGVTKAGGVEERAGVLGAGGPEGVGSDVDFVLGKGRGGAPIRAAGGKVAEVEIDSGTSTRRMEPVGFFTFTGEDVPSSSRGRPGAAVTPVRVLGSGGTAFLSTRGMFPVDDLAGGVRGGGVVAVKGGWGAKGVGARLTAPSGRLGGVASLIPLVAGVTFGGIPVSGGAFAGVVVARLETVGSVWVAGKAGERELKGTGSRSSGASTFPLLTNTLACGLATITRGGGADGSAGLRATGAAAMPGLATTAVEVESAPTVVEANCVGGLEGKRGVVLELGGAPVTGGALGLVAGSELEAGLEILGIGRVTAVDQAGGVVCDGTGLIEAMESRGSVVAAPIFGRGVI